MDFLTVRSITNQSVGADITYLRTGSEYIRHDGARRPVGVYLRVHVFCSQSHQPWATLTDHDDDVSSTMTTDLSRRVGSARHCLLLVPDFIERHSFISLDPQCQRKVAV